MLASSPHNQRGVVLIMALLIVVLVTTVVVQVSWRFNLSVARNENRWHGAQARAFMEGGEQLAMLVLRMDAQQTGFDSLAEDWAMSQQMPLDAEYGESYVAGQLEDAHGRFNLNSLVPPPPNPAQGAGNSRGNNNQPIPPEDLYSAPQRRFIRFLQTIELESGPVDQATALDIVAGIADWIDQDNQVTQGPIGGVGAERNHYEGLDPPVYMPNTEMTSVSELSLIKGVTPELYKKLEPFVIALPDGKNFMMNINTVRPEMLRAFNLKEDFYPLDESSATTLLEAKGMMPEGFPSIEEFENGISQALGLSPGQVDTEGLDVNSLYFIFNGEAKLGEQMRRSKSLLFRNGAKVEVVRRTDGSF